MPGVALRAGLCIASGGLPDAILSWVNGMNIGPVTVILALMLVYVILGAVLESLSMILLTVPIFFPLVQSLDFGHGWLATPDNVAIWFGILVVVVQRDVPITTMFRGVLPFWGIDLVRLAALIAFPPISLILLN